MRIHVALFLTAALALGAVRALPAGATGLLRPVDASYKDLEIKEHKVSVVINNGFARTEVDQVFLNPNDRDLDALYTFPVPEKASMSELSLWIDGKERIGEVLAKEKARQAYEDERSKGRDAALNEKDGYKAFQVSVSPVRAGKEARVRLVYYQPLDMDHGVGRFVYPMQEGGVDDARDLAFFLNDTVTGEASFALKARIKTSYPIEEVLVPSHPEAAVRKLEQGGYEILVSSPGTASLSRDFVLHYRLAASHPAGVELIPYRGKGQEEGTFMIVATPGDDLKPLAKGADWTFVLDISGSMADKLPALVRGVEKALGTMRPEDRFRIALFNERAQWLIGRFTPATKAEAEAAVSGVLKLQACGGTNMYAGLEQGLQGLDGERTSAVLLVTDGVANVGVTEHRKFLDLVRDRDVRLYTFVMGNAANTPLLGDLAAVSGGFAESVSTADSIVGKILLVKSKLTHEALHQASVDIAGIQTFGLTPEKPLTLYRGDQLVVFGRYRGEGKGQLSLRAKVSGKPVSYKIPVTFPKVDERSPELERLWALARIEELGRQKRLGADAREVDATVRDLGTRYSLVTDETSMVVMADESFASRGIGRENLGRVQRERAAQQARAAAVPPSYSGQYSPSPISSSPIPRVGGGGAAGPFFAVLVLLAGGVNAALRKRRDR
ncbi:MAG: VWA domain-containing protein [Elusimicrobia bacterium]|nr:VWA domain-containing protein [Elusimicrobiota bacterium]